jgi:predicted GNAT family N-acyltransferase
MGQTDDILIVKAQTPAEREACFAIREEVFIKGQNVPVERERDGLDDEALHFLATNKGKPVGTARVRFKDEVTAKVERVAVVESARGLKIGKKLMQFIEMDDAVKSRPKIILQAQSYIVPFYESLGYEAYGDELMDVGIPHRNMSKQKVQSLKP